MAAARASCLLLPTADARPARAMPPRLSVAPMLDYTNVHYRQLCRLISKHTVLYTEMEVDNTILQMAKDGRPLAKVLSFPESQQPLVLQLGGSDPGRLRDAAAAARSFGHTEINLNCGCPSDKVAGDGGFGAALMKEPRRVAAACAAIAEGLGPGGTVTVKCRTGVDDADSYSELAAFIATVSSGAGVAHFIVHARKAVLGGLSPADNRRVPPLTPGKVHALARDFPGLEFTLNGGVRGTLGAEAELARPGVPQNLVGVMIGRAVTDAPWAALSGADARLFAARDVSSSHDGPTSRRAVLASYASYADAELGRWGPGGGGRGDPSVRALATPLLNLFHGEPGGRAWRRCIDGPRPLVVPALTD